MDMDEDEDFAHVPFDDDEEEAQQQQHQQPQPTAAINDDSLLLLSGDAADISGLDTTGVSGLDESREDDAGSKRPAAEPLKRKRRKRRKVVVDNDATELSNEHIKDMLADTSDIVKRQVHPADADAEEEDGDEGERPVATLVPVLTQCFLADDGHLHPALANLWKENFYRALDAPCPFERRAEEDDVEQVREAPKDEDEASRMSDLEDQGPQPTMENDPQQQEEEETEDFAAPPMEEEEEEDNNFAMPFDDEEEEGVAQHADDGIGDLGLVNELQLDSDEEDDEEAREAVGEHTGTKWHKHTVKVLKLLQSRMRPANAEDDQEEEAKPTSLEFGELAKNVNRRTAASCFIECLVSDLWFWIKCAIVNRPVRSYVL